jgi:hypothetical protein
MALSRLDALFEKVISAELPAARAAVLGEHLESPADQKAAYALLRKSEKSGKRLTNDEVREMIRFAPQAGDRQDPARGGNYELVKKAVDQIVGYTNEPDNVLVKAARLAGTSWAWRRSPT